MIFKQQRDDGFALANVIVIAAVVVSLLTTLVAVVGVNISSSRQVEQDAVARITAESVFDDIYARMITRELELVDGTAVGPHYFASRVDASARVQCDASDTTASCLGAYPAMHNDTSDPAVDSPVWHQFDDDGALAPCADLQQVCFYVRNRVLQINADGQFFQPDPAEAENLARQRSVGDTELLWLEVTTRANCRGSGDRCEFIRMQQKLRERVYTDFVSLTDREVMDPLLPAESNPFGSGICEEKPLGWRPGEAATTGGAAVVPVATIRDQDPAQFGGCIPVPYTGLELFECVQSACDDNEPGSMARFSGSQYIEFPGVTAARPASGNPFMAATDTLTVQLWMQAANPQGGTQILYEEGGSGNGVALYVQDGYLYGVVHSDTWAIAPSALTPGFSGALVTRTPIEANRTYLVALVYEDRTAKLYLDPHLQPNPTQDCDTAWVNAWIDQFPSGTLTPEQQAELSLGAPLAETACVDRAVHTGLATLPQHSGLGGLGAVVQNAKTFATDPLADGSASGPVSQQLLVGQTWVSTGQAAFSGVIDNVARYQTAVRPTRLAIHGNSVDLSAEGYFGRVQADQPAVYYSLDGPPGVVAFNSGATQQPPFTDQGPELNATYVGFDGATRLVTPGLVGLATNSLGLLSIRDVVNGPVHTNDSWIYACGSLGDTSVAPIFLDLVQGTATAGQSGGSWIKTTGESGCGGPVSALGGQMQGPSLDLPQSGEQVQVLTTRYIELAGGSLSPWVFGTSSGCTIDSEVLVRLVGSRMVVASACDNPAALTTPPRCPAGRATTLPGSQGPVPACSLDLPPSGVMYAKGSLDIRQAGQFDVADANAACAGPQGRGGGGLRGRLTVVGRGNVSITGDLTYCTATPRPATDPTTVGTSPPQTVSAATDMLGIVALPWTEGELIALTTDCSAPGAPVGCVSTSTSNTTGAIRLPNTVATGTYAPVVIQAVLAAPNRSVFVDRWQQFALTQSPGRIIIDGAIISKYRPVFTGFSGDVVVSGMVKDLQYDPRLRSQQPPFMLRPVISSWERIELVEVPGIGTGL